MSFNLGKLEKVALRDVWQKEDLDFTPWLAQEENIAILGETIGIELEVEGTEKDVGPFRADILCKDTVTDNWVLVENQLEKTDHTHLGQLLTYASGLNAVTIVWVAKRFTDEHRSALDWLNEITDNTFNFFGIEVELWKIGGSSIAPNFKIVSKPNEWTKSISKAASRVQSENFTEARKLQLEYWTALRNYLYENSTILKPQKASPKHWMNFAIGRSYFHMSSIINTQQNTIGVVLVIKGEDAKAHFNLLLQDREVIDAELTEPVDWKEMPDKKESRIKIIQNSDPWDKGSWDAQHKWLKDKLEEFHNAFSKRIQSLNADDYQEE